MVGEGFVKFFSKTVVDGLVGEELEDAKFEKSCRGVGTFTRNKVELIFSVYYSANTNMLGWRVGFQDGDRCH